MNAPTTFKYRWWWKPSPMRPIDRRGQACRILARSKRETPGKGCSRGKTDGVNSILVEFLDGFQVVTSRHAVRSYFESKKPR
jgi:hypothetical protein